MAEGGLIKHADADLRRCRSGACGSVSTRGTCLHWCTHGDSPRMARYARAQEDNQVPLKPQSKVRPAAVVQFIRSRECCFLAATRQPRRGWRVHAERPPVESCMQAGPYCRLQTYSEQKFSPNVDNIWIANMNE